MTIFVYWLLLLVTYWKLSV